MTTAATSLLGLALPVTGELSGTWGDTVNNSITSLLDTAVAGTTTLSTDADVTLTTTTLAANQARQAILLCSGARTALRTITAPAQSKIYTIINATTGGFSVKLVGVGPTTGLTIPNGASAVVAWNGSDFIEIGSSTIGNLVVNGNLTVTGSTTLSGGTANGVAYLNGSKVVTTGSALTFDGSQLAVTGSVKATAALSGVWDGSTGTYQTYKYNGTSVGDIGTANQAVNGSTGDFAITSRSGNLIFGQNTVEQMRLTSTGLGIGTSSPVSKLDVYSTGNTTLTISGSSGGGGDVSQIDFFRIGSNVTSSVKAIRDGGNTSGALTFYTALSGSNTERMRLDSSGNLGLGVTPSAVASSDRVLQVRNFLFDDNSNGYGILRYNNYFNGTNDVYLNTGTVSAFQMAGNAFRWYQAASGTAGTAITFTQAMTLDASGNLSLSGNSSPTLAFNGTATSGGRGILFQYNGTQYGRVTQTPLTGELRITSGESGQTGYYTTFYTDGSERARFDSSGNFGIGTTTPASYGKLVAYAASGASWIVSVSGSNQTYMGYDVSIGANAIESTGALVFATKAGFAESARFDTSGNFFIGTTNIGYSRKLGVTSSGDAAMIQTTGSATSTPCEFWNTATSGDNRFTFFYTEGTPTARGSIDYNRAGGLTRYNTTSDQRLKENIVDAPSAMSLINGIKIRSFDWKETGFHVDHGVIAQELQQVVPEAVSVGDDNEDESVKKPWGVDTSVLVPALVKALQEMKAIIDDQAARIAALEAK